MALLSCVAGRYSASWDPVGATGASDLGVMEKGYEIAVTVDKEMINETDKFGLMVVDAVYRGLSDITVQMNALEWVAGVLLAAFPYGAVVPPSGANFLGPGIIGRLDSDIAGALILTATTGTPAASKPATLTANYTIIHERTPINLMFNSMVRRLPLKMRIYVYDDSGTVKAWTAT